VESETEEMEIMEEEGVEKSRECDEKNVNIEERRDRIKTNLEILLSQNDILPLIKKINKEKSKSSGIVLLNKYVRKKEKVKFS
jgi:hypothetical protein